VLIPNVAGIGGGGRVPHPGSTCRDVPSSKRPSTYKQRWPGTGPQGVRGLEFPNLTAYPSSRKSQAKAVLISQQNPPRRSITIFCSVSEVSSVGRFVMGISLMIVVVVVVVVVGLAYAVSVSVEQ